MAFSVLGAGNGGIDIGTIGDGASNGGDGSLLPSIEFDSMLK